MLDVSDVGASPCQVMAEGTWAARHPFLRLRGVDGGRENGGRAVQRTTGGRNSSHRSGREGKDARGWRLVPPLVSCSALSLVDTRSWFCVSPQPLKERESDFDDLKK